MIELASEPDTHYRGESTEDREVRIRLTEVARRAAEAWLDSHRREVLEALVAYGELRGVRRFQDLRDEFWGTAIDEDERKKGGR